MSAHRYAGWYVGDRVRVKRGRSRRTARIISYLPNTDGGVRLDEKLYGFQFWSIDELENMTAKETKIKRDEVNA